MAKYKLGNRLHAFVNDNVLPKYTGEVEREMVEDFERYNNIMGMSILISNSKTTHGFTLTVYVQRCDLEEIE